MTHHEDHEVDHDAAVDRLPDDRAAEADDPHVHSPNPTQERIDREEDTARPVDVDWEQSTGDEEQ
jgi:hypothetical protein